MDQTSSNLPLSEAVIVVSPQFCAPYPVDLAVSKKAKALTDGNFAVTDVNGNVIFKIKEKLLSLHARRVLLDASGNPLLSLKEKMKSTHSRWRVFRGDSDDSKDLIFTVKQPSMLQSKTKLDVFLANNTKEKVCDFKVRGSWSKRSCIITNGDSNTTIAQLDKKNTFLNKVGKDAFMVKVYPNVDHAFIVALIAILDAIYGYSVEALQLGIIVGVITGG